MRKINEDRKKIVIINFIIGLILSYVIFLLLKYFMKIDLYASVYSIFYLSIRLVVILCFLVCLLGLVYKDEVTRFFRKIRWLIIFIILSSGLFVSIDIDNIPLSIISFILLLSFVLFLYFKTYPTFKQSPLDPIKDTPICDKKDDLLGRGEFIENFIKIIRNTTGKGNRLLLSGKWGSGKTSVLNSVENELKNDNTIYFKRVNPWQNDTKERFAQALLYEIDNFSNNTIPYFSVFDKFYANLINHLDSLSVGPINFNFPKETANIGNSIEEIQEYLKLKREKLVIVIDDLDRLSKRQILDVLGIIYMFSECYNIVFILSANIEKVEDILTEVTEPNNFSEKYKTIKKANYYSHYLEKMTSNIIKLPEILPEHVNSFFINQIDAIFKQEKIPLLTTIEKKSFPISHINDLRTIKRILQGFKNSFLQPKVRTEVNPFHFLLLTILFVRFPNVYYELSNNRYLCTESYLKDYPNKQSDIKKFCDNILNLNPEYRKFIKDILLILIPNYVKSLYTENIDENADFILYMQTNCPIIGEQVEKAFYKENYIDRYFVENISENIIPDKELDSMFNGINTRMSSSQIIDILTQFIISNITKINSFFNYISSTQKISDSLLNDIFQACALVLNKREDMISIKSKEILLNKMLKMIENFNIYNKTIENTFDKINSIYIKCRIYLRIISQNSKIQDILEKKLNNKYPTNTNIIDIIEEDMKYDDQGGWGLYLWLKEFNAKAKICSERKEKIKNIIMDLEKYFWFSTGQKVYDNIKNQSKFFLPDFSNWTLWVPKEMVEITDTLLKKENLKHKKEIAVINEYYRQKIEPTIR